MNSLTSSQLIKKMERLKVVSNKLAEDVLAGAYRSAFKGQGMEFDEVREYQEGDEVRSIDWNVTARMNHPYVKVFTEERDLTLFLLVDLSASTRFGSTNMSKKDLITEVGSVLAFSALKNNDRIGLILFSEVVEKFLPPGKGISHSLHLIRELLAFQPKHVGTNIDEPLAYLGNLQKRAICFLISDFLFPPDATKMGLLARKHDLIAISVQDPLEKSMPNGGLMQLQDLESGEEVLFDSGSKQMTKEYADMAAAQERETINLFNKLNIGHIALQTDKDYIPPLRKFFRMRELQRRV